MENRLRKPNVFIVCTGVGHITRGFESFTSECFKNQKDSTVFNLYLLKGAGKSTSKELSIGCITRNSPLAKFLSKITGKETYWIEQITFLIGMLPSLCKYKPSVIYYSDFTLGTFLWHLRKYLKFKYKLLFSNGAPNGPPFKTEDHVQQLLPLYIRIAERENTPLSKQTLLPYAINIDKVAITQRLENRETTRNALALPKDKKIIICVGAVNSHHKRINYLIKEFELMNSCEYFLVILGQIDELSIPILEQAKNELPLDSYLIKQVDGSSVIDYLTIADYFILPSLQEGLPRVLPEALSAGLLPIVHDYDVTRETLSNYGVFKDMTKPGVLPLAIKEADERAFTKVELIDYAVDHYSWDVLGPKYEDMIFSCIS